MPSSPPSRVSPQNGMGKSKFRARQVRALNPSWENRDCLGSRMVRVTIRIDLSDEDAVGPGKIRLLELIRDTGSISAAGRAMEMSYRRAWLLVEELNGLFRKKVATTKLGGK